MGDEGVGGEGFQFSRAFSLLVRIFTEARSGFSMKLSLELSLKCSLELPRDVTVALMKEKLAGQPPSTNNITNAIQNGPSRDGIDGHLATRPTSEITCLDTLITPKQHKLHRRNGIDIETVTQPFRATTEKTIWAPTQHQQHKKMQGKNDAAETK